MWETSIGTPAPAAANRLEKVRVHGRKLYAFQFFKHLAAGVGTVRQFPHEHFGKAFFADFQLLQLVVNLGCDCECDSRHELIIHEPCTKARQNGGLVVPALCAEVEPPARLCKFRIGAGTELIRRQGGY